MAAPNGNDMATMEFGSEGEVALSIDEGENNGFGLEWGFRGEVVLVLGTGLGNTLGEPTQFSYLF